MAELVCDFMEADPPARLIHRLGHDRLPVVEDGRLVRVVTRVDVLGALTR